MNHILVINDLDMPNNKLFWTNKAPRYNNINIFTVQITRATHYFP